MSLNNSIASIHKLHKSGLEAIIPKYLHSFKYFYIFSFIKIITLCFPLSHALTPNIFFTKYYFTSLFNFVLLSARIFRLLLSKVLCPLTEPVAFKHKLNKLGYL